MQEACNALDTLEPRQNDRHFAEGICKYDWDENENFTEMRICKYDWDENAYFRLISSMTKLFQRMNRWQKSDKPLSDAIAA